MNIIVLIILIFLFQPTVEIVTAAFILKQVYDGTVIAKNAIKLAKTVNHFFDANENLEDFIEKNWDSKKRYQNEVNEKLDLIQKTFDEIHDEIGHLEYLIDKKDYQNNVMEQTNVIFKAVQKFWQYRSNSSTESLRFQCHKPPNRILEKLINILRDNWLITQTKKFKYESKHFFKLVHEIDTIAESLAISQGACSGLEDNPTFEMTQLKKDINLTLRYVNKAKQEIHNVAFNYSKTFVKKYLSSYSKNSDKSIGEKNVEIATYLIQYFATNYNYGLYYNIFVSNEKTSKFAENSLQTFDASNYYNVFSNGISVTIVRAPPCSRMDNDIKRTFQTFRNEAECSNNLLGESVACFDVFASNGGMCQLETFKYSDKSGRTLITQSIPTNFISKTLVPTKYVLMKSHTYEYIDPCFNIIDPQNKPFIRKNSTDEHLISSIAKSGDNTAEIFIEDKLFIDQEHENMTEFSSFFTESDDENTTTISTTEMVIQTYEKTCKPSVDTANPPIFKYILIIFAFIVIFVAILIIIRILRNKGYIRLPRR